MEHIIIYKLSEDHSVTSCMVFVYNNSNLRAKYEV